MQVLPTVKFGAGPGRAAALLVVVLLLYGSADALLHEGGPPLAEDGGADREPLPETPERILSRKRRFLTFPEGSSFQVVYDQTIPMIGVESLFTIGITVALAYELPSITFDQIWDMIEQNANDPDILPKVDSAANGTILVDTKPLGVTPARKNILSYAYQPAVSPAVAPGTGGHINYYTATADKYGNRRYDNYDRYGHRAPSRWEQFVSDELVRRPPGYAADRTPNDFGSIVNRYLANWIRQHPPNYAMNKKRFYPVFGKRSIREDTAPLDRHFLNHHRVTRHALYERIEQFLTAKGKHGHHCVLRALCESGQRKHDTEPDTFLREILRAVFSLPTTHETPSQHKHRLYDEAHAHTGNCTETYTYCKDSFWSPDFVF